MYCGGACKYLNKKKHLCEKTGEKLAYVRVNGPIRFTVHEHNGICEYEKQSVAGEGGRKSA